MVKGYDTSPLGFLVNKGCEVAVNCFRCTWNWLSLTVHQSDIRESQGVPLCGTAIYGSHSSSQWSLMIVVNVVKAE